MPALPAICNNPRCGTVFPSCFFVENSTNMSIAACDGGRCPKCGSIGRISNGVYNVIAEKVSGMLQNEYDLTILTHLKTIVEKGIDDNNVKKAKEELSAIGPNWWNAFGALPEENVGNALTIYVFILAMIQTAISLYTLNKPADTNIFINQSYEFFYNESPQLTPPEPPIENKTLQTKPPGLEV